MILIFAILALVTLAGAIAAMSLRNLVHCALCLVLALGGLATLFLQLEAQFVGLAQILVYIGAVAILIVFAILLTRGGEPPQQPVVTSSWVMGAGVAVLPFGTPAGAILATRGAARGPHPQTHTAARGAV